MTLEIVVYNIESAMNAQKGGADRIELCDNPSEGGTTPSCGVIAQVRQHLSIDVYVMIRPRGGDFVYSIDEYHAMRKDIEMCKRLSVDGVVLGMLTAEGRIDVKYCKKLIEFARPLKVTCHRAFDMTRDATEALEDCIEAGFDKILTSGRQPNAELGSDLIQQLVIQAGNRISIMAGAGVTEKNVVKLVQQTGVKEVHFSAKRFKESTNTRHNHLVSFLDALPSDSGQYISDPELIKNIRAKLLSQSRRAAD
jgi:copper homeostasis protein